MPLGYCQESYRTNRSLCLDRCQGIADYLRVPGYRPPSTEPRGKWAKRIHEKRRAEGLSQTGAFELLRERLGYGPKSRFSYVALDMGTREPTDAEAKVLAEWLGGYPDDMADSGDATTATSELAALVQSINALVEEMRAARQADQARQRDEIATAVREAVEPLWQLMRGALPPREGPAHGGATPAGRL